MKYLLFYFDNEQFWIEVGPDGYALRHIVIDVDGGTHISCLEDCLAEGIINENEFDGEIRLITQYEFENKWDAVTSEKRKSWDVLKKEYPIGKEVECKTKYSYPQGWILDIGQTLGICKCTLNLYHDDLFSGKVIGYDEVNMWIEISVE